MGTRRLRTLKERVLRPIVEFTQLEASSGILLIACSIVALIWANSSWASSYFSLWNIEAKLALGNFEITKTLHHWINEGLMAGFFFLVGLEVKREILVGELQGIKKAALPVAAAVGGMLLPAIIYLLFNWGGKGSSGWGIPMATDIAFALGVLALLGNRIPVSLRVFLASLAIADDIGAILVIALFYTSQVDLSMLAYAGVTFAALLGLNRLGGRAPIGYILLGLLLWFFFLKSGIHSTIAGVLLAATIPARIRMNAGEFVTEAKELLQEIDPTGESNEPVMVTEEKQSAIRALERACEDVQMPIERMENTIHPWVTFGIMPIFALANAGVALGHAGGQTLLGAIPLGIVLGLILGKPLGIFLFSWLAIKLKFASLPSDFGFKQLLGVGMLGGIGFTMSFFIADLAFGISSELQSAKLGIILASTIAAIGGFLLLKTNGSGQQV